MSFTDDENKRIEEESLKAEEEIRERFRNILFKDDLEDSVYKPSRKPSGSSRVVQKVDVKSDGKSAAQKTSRKSTEPGKKKRSAVSSDTIVVEKKRSAASDAGQRRKPAAASDAERKPSQKRRSASARSEASERPYRPEFEPEPERDYTGIPESFYIRPGVLWFRQDVIPSAASELSRSDELNDRRKVRKRVKRLEKNAGQDSFETIRRSQVSYFSDEFRDDCIIPERRRSDPRRLPSSSRDRRFRIQRVDNSKKAIRRRGRRNKPQGPGGKIATIIIILLVIGIAAAGYLGAKTVFDDAAMDPQNLAKIEYTVTEATSDDEVAAFLVKNGMVESELLYKLRAKIFDAEYVAGTYELSPSYSTEKIINILSGFDYSSGG